MKQLTLLIASILIIPAACLGAPSVYAEVEPFDLNEVLDLEDSIPLNSQKAQDIMEDAFQRSNGAADAYTWDASGLNDYGYDPYALDYEFSGAGGDLFGDPLGIKDAPFDLLFDEQFGIVYDPVSGDAYTDEGAPLEEGFGDFLYDGGNIWGNSGYGSDYVSGDDYATDSYTSYDYALLDEAFSNPKAAVALDMYGPSGTGATDGFDIYMDDYLIAETPELNTDSLRLVDLPLSRIEHDAVLISGSKDRDEVLKKIHERGIDREMTADYFFNKDKTHVWDQFDNIMMGVGISANEITHSLETGYNKGEVDLDTRVRIEDVVGATPLGEKHNLSPILEVSYGLGKPWKKDLVLIGDLPTNRYETSYMNISGVRGFAVAEMGSIVRNENALRTATDNDKILYDELKAKLGPRFSLPEFEAADRNAIIANNRRKLDTHEGTHIAVDQQIKNQIIEASTSDFFDGDMNKLLKQAEDQNEAVSYFASVAVSDYPQMDLISMNLETVSMPKEQLNSTDPGRINQNANYFARKLVAESTLNASGFPDHMAKAEAMQLGDGYVTELEADIVLEKVNNKEYYKPDYVTEQTLYLSILPAEKIKEYSAHRVEDWSGSPPVRLPPMPDDDRY